MATSKTRCVGILTSGGDCPGLNAAIRGVVKAAIGCHGIKCVGILDGFRGLVENRTIPLDDRAVSGILTMGGTLLGTSRDKPHKMPMGGKVRDMTEVAVENAKRMQIDCLVCLGGAGTQKNAFRLSEAGLNVLTLPKTIDNDIWNTDVTFGYDTALDIASEAIDRLHTTATSHQRIIVVEIMGHKAGWLTLGSGIAGGADVILIPEIPYAEERVAEHLLDRSRHGKRFSIVAVAEGALSVAEAKAAAAAESGKKAKKERKAKKSDTEARARKAAETDEDYSPTETVMVKSGEGAPVEATYHTVQEPKASRLARALQRLTGTEARVTTLGHVQRGGTPSASDRLLCTRLGTAAADLLAQGRYGFMMAVKGDEIVPVRLEDVAGKLKLVPPDHASVRAARSVGTCMGD
jgi:ATP-dependent phosphofructokinase / diphosphate-dependent phosphofructokinase